MNFLVHREMNLKPVLHFYFMKAEFNFIVKLAVSYE